MDNRKTGKQTQCVHAGAYVDEKVGGVTTPIYASSSYRYSFEQGGARYPRYYNIPTQKAAADKIRTLENGQAGLVVSSGMGAETAVFFGLLQAGDHILVQNDVYGGTFHFIASECGKFGIEVDWVQAGQARDFEPHIRKNTKMIYFESPTNPLLGVLDMEEMVGLAGSRGILTVIDNTFASPINQNPLDWGVDVVIHSGTKYLGGHSDLICGAIVTGESLMDKILFTAINHGMVLGPMECYRLERSMKTLGIRVERINKNGQALAEFLSGCRGIKKVNYPGLAEHPGHETARKQMRGFGGMLSAELDCDRETAYRIVERLQIFTHAVSLGGVESLVCFPALTSHEKMPAEERKKLGIGDSLVRISCGIEDSEDLIGDWARALDL